MRIGPLGTREVSALVLLVGALAAGLAVTVFRADDEGVTNAAQDRIAERTAAADPNRTVAPPTPTKTPTSLPTLRLTPPKGWQISYESKAISGGYTPETVFAVEDLDLSFAAAPLPDIKDNAWRAVVASQIGSDRPGPWNFTIEYQGTIKVFVAENLVAEGTNAKVTKLEVKVPSDALRTSIRIEAEDTGGQFLLRWK